MLNSIGTKTLLLMVVSAIISFYVARALSRVDQS